MIKSQLIKKPISNLVERYIMHDLKQIIEHAYLNIKTITALDTEVNDAVNTVINTLDCGGIRVAENMEGNIIIHDWIKKAILLSFRLNPNQVTETSWIKFYDKVALKYADYSEETFKQEGTRIVPGAIVRKGAYVGKNTVLMPCFVNIGAHIGDNTMIDTWSTVGSCAQIGKNVHLSGGVGIGGVLEPLQASPVIIGDDCFIGARSEVVEGVIIEQGAVLSMGVYLSQSTKIYDRETGSITYGKIPAYSVVVPGNLPSKCGKYSMYAAIIIKKVDEGTRSKVSINDLLRE